MAKDWTGLASRASTLVGKFGTSVTVTRTGETTPDGDRPWEISASDTDYTVTAVREDYRDAQVDGETIKIGDRRYLIAANDIAIQPEPGDTITDGAEWTIVHVQTESPGGTDLVYACQVRM